MHSKYYAIEVGKMRLRSDRPITAEEHQRVRELLKEHVGPWLVLDGDLEVEVVVG